MGDFVTASSLQHSLQPLMTILKMQIAAKIMIATTTAMQGTTYTATKTAAIAQQKQARNEPIMKHSCQSITWRSLLKRFRILPIGVTSQNKLIGARKTFASIELCNILIALKLPKIRQRTLQKTKKAVAKLTVKVKIKKYLNLACCSSGVQFAH